MSISERLHILFEIIRVGKLKKIMENVNFNEFNAEQKLIRDYEDVGDYEPLLYEFRNFKINKIFNNNKIFILNVIKMTSVHALRYFKNILTIDLKNNDEKNFVREIIKICPIGLYNLPFKVIYDYDIACDIAVHYGGILEFLTKDGFINNKEFVKKCYTNHISCLQYATDNLLNDEEFMFDASVYSLDALYYLSKKLKNNIIFFDKLIKLKPDKIDIILRRCGGIVFEEYKSTNYKSISNEVDLYYKTIEVDRLFGQRIECHKNVPINLQTKNKFRKVRFYKKFRYNHYFISTKDDFNEKCMYSYY